MKPIMYRDHLILPHDNRVAVMVPHAKTFIQDGQQLMLVPHKVDETQVLRNLGYDVRPPVLLSYDWPAPPDQPVFDAQRVTTALITTNKRSYVLNSLGTGKTRSALYAYDYLKKSNQNYGKLLITAPLSTLRQTWEREITMLFPWMKVAILHGSKAKRVEQLHSGADIFIINHDGIETIFKELKERVSMFSMAILDELSIYKNTKTDMWKATYALISDIDRVVGMTGTPMTLAATDVYGQVKMITPASLGGKSFPRFRETVQKKVSQFRWVDFPTAIDTVHNLMQPAVRFTRDECYDMPECQYVERMTPLSKQQLKAFKQMHDENAVPSYSIVAVNAADTINKLKQIALGNVYDTDRNIVALDNEDSLKDLELVIEQSASKVIVFTPYKHSLAQLVERVGSRWTVEEVSGDTSPAKRNQIFTMFMQSPDPHVLVAHPECMSHGLTLTEASTIVWWGPPDSLETYEQANGRITRAGQKHSQLIVHMVRCKLEQTIFGLLKRRANVQQVLLDMFESQDKSDLS